MTTAGGDERVKPLADDPGLPALVARLIDDARNVARAEVDVVKAKAGERIEAYKGAAIVFGAAAVIASSAVTALLVGLILSLATLIGPGWATLAVVLGSLVVAGVLAMIGAGRLKGASPP